MQFITIILSILILFLLVLAGRTIYERSVRLRNKLQMAQVFTNISHELLTPLTVLSASIERMRIREPHFEQDYALMDMNIDRMVRLLQEILETSKSLSGELKLSVAQADVMAYINQTALCLEPLMAKKHIHFTVSCSPKSMMGWIDTDKLDKIIYNLLSNAAKYTPDGGKVSVTVNTNKKYDHIVIEVRDNGIGIPQDRIKKLFHRFYDGDYRKMQTTGTGLGLALTRDLIYLHGGTIDYETQEGAGTTFFVTIPINKESFTSSQINEDYQVELGKPQKSILDYDKLLLPAEDQESSALASVSNTDDDTYRLLIVEDNLDLLLMMQALLGQKYQVCTAQNGVEALEKVKSEELDLVISDVMMPEMDGNELTRQLKSNPNTSHLPIILLTAKTQEEDRKKSMLLGADDYIAKPFKLGDLDLRIKNIIENRKRIEQEFISRSADEPQQKDEALLTPDERFLQKAINCVYAHLDDEDFDRDSFASDMGASASTLYNKLRSITGMNVSSFIRDIRMKEAKRLAKTQPDLRVSDLAYMVGFKDPKYFSTCFKKEFGIQPSEFLEQENRKKQTKQ